jgi:Carboxypeptidase regulatory-like domain
MRDSCRPFELLVNTLLTVTLVSLSYSQGLTGQISGSIREQSGAIVVGAAVELLNQGTSQIRSTVTDSLGEYVFRSCWPDNPR